MVHTKGNIIVDNIKIGDIHYEFSYSMGTKVEVLTLPTRNDEGLWTWKSRNVTTGYIIDYSVHEKFTQYSPNLYDQSKKTHKSLACVMNLTKSNSNLELKYIV